MCFCCGGKKLYYSDQPIQDSNGDKLEVFPDYSNIIALKYDGEYYYKHEKGTLTAIPQDVLNGKTFIGQSGTVETGTMEV